MSWDELQAQWQRTAPASGAPAIALAQDVRERARRLRRTIVRRDWLETVVAVVLLPLAGLWAWQAWADHDVWRLGFAVLLGAWLVYVPWRLWRARRTLPRPSPGQPLLEYLSQQRAALLTQARMLETVWRWYLLPPVVALSGMELARHGFTWPALVLVGIFVFGALGIHAMNQRAARTVFRAQAAEIDAQLQSLRGDA